MAKSSEPNYQELNAQLEAILSQLENGQLDVDEAIKQYEKGMEIVKELEKYLKTAENKVKKVQDLRKAG